MSTSSATPSFELPAADRRALDLALLKVWRRGANVIIGWRLAAFGIRVLYLSSYDLPQWEQRRPDLLRYDRFIKTDQEFVKLFEEGCKEASLEMANSFSDTEGVHAAINDIIRYYSVTQFECRAVALYDIVSFSVYSPFEQITQISALSYYINLAGQRCKSLGMPLDLCMSTTGDGFYIWNRNVGLLADIALYAVSLLALAYNAAARDLAATESVPRLRCAIHFGANYEHYQPTGERVDRNGYIVGDVTINLARLISEARTSQLLVGSYVRHLRDLDAEWQDQLGVATIDTPVFMSLAQIELAELVGLPIPGGKIDNVKAYFTGPRVSASEFSIRKYFIMDKHGLEHGCFNTKFNIEKDNDVHVFFGLLDKDLENFKARWSEDDDIEVRII